MKTIAALFLCLLSALTLTSHRTQAAENGTVPPVNPGIVVCEPIAPPTDAALGKFGAGCGRWLFFAVGGHAELGQTPLWSEVDRARGEMNRPDLRLNLADAAQLAAKLGVTHVAVGAITGDASHCTLVYQLYAVPSRTQIGPALTLAGTEEQIIAALPETATQLARLLGVTTPRVPATVGATPAELGLIGSVAWGPDTPLTGWQTTAMTALALRSPLAGLLAMKNSLRSDPPRIEAAVKLLMGQAADNPLVLGQISYVYGSALIPYEAQDTRLSDQYPHSYALARIGLWMTRSLNEYSLQLPFAARMVKAAPQSPDAWLGLSATLSEAAESVRKSKVAAAITASEQTQLDTLYPEWQFTAQKATQLDPTFGRAWLQLAQAATFNGDDSIAQGAFWKALRFDPRDSDVYGWGLQMFQEKWGGDPATLAKVAHLAASDKHLSVADETDVASSLSDAGFDDASDTMINRALNDAMAEILHHYQYNPSQAYSDMATAMEIKRELEGAPVEVQHISIYRKAVSLLPNDPSLHYGLGLSLSQTGQSKEAAQQFREAIRVAPRFQAAHYELGLCLKRLGQMNDAAQEFQTAASLDSQYAEPHYGLGAIAETKKDRKDAISEYRKAVVLEPYYREANDRLLTLLYEDGRWDEALETGLPYVKAASHDRNAWIIIAEVFLKMKAWDDAIAASDIALKLDPKDAAAHMNRGQALWGKGSKAKARVEWKKVLVLNNAALAQEARKHLANNA